MSAGDRPIGIIAGFGFLPVEAARAIVDGGGRVHIVIADDNADPALTAFPHTFVNWAQLGRAIAALERAGVRDVLMLGATGRPSFRTARPDWGFIQALPSIVAFLNAGGDDAVLRGLARLFERHGLRIVGPSAVVPGMLIGAGQMTAAGSSEQDRTDSAKGFALISALGQHDIGQGAVVRDGTIVAIEGAEGTDRMLQHAASRRGDTGPRSGVLVKLPKPGQDMRFDLPTIGPKTIENVGRAGLAGASVMAGEVLAAERQRMIEIADAHGLFVSGVDAPNATPSTRRQMQPMPAGIPARERRDAEKAANILMTLDGFGCGTALVIFENRVIALGTDDVAGDVIRRAGVIRRPRRRKGLAAIGLRGRVDADAISATAEANLAGAVVLLKPEGTIQHSMIDLAHQRGLFIATVVVEGSDASGN